MNHHFCTDYKDCGTCPKAAECHCPYRTDGKSPSGRRSFWTREKAVECGHIDEPDEGVTKAKSTGYIVSLELTKEFRGIAPKVIEFRPGLNLLVGDQGCGKSTCLQILATKAGVSGKKPSHDMAQFKGKAEGGPKVLFFDFEKDNPRIQSELTSMVTITSRFASHGQTVNGILAGAGRKMDGHPHTFLLDEPDMALSCRSVLKLVDSLQQLVDGGHQVIAAVHHPWLIEQFPEVLDMEKNEWMSSTKFLASMREPVV